MTLTRGDAVAEWYDWIPRGTQVYGMAADGFPLTEPREIRPDDELYEDFIETNSDGVMIGWRLTFPDGTFKDIETDPLAIHEGDTLDTPKVRQVEK